MLYSPGIFRYLPFPHQDTIQPGGRPKQEPISTVDLPAGPYWRKSVGDGGPS